MNNILNIVHLFITYGVPVIALLIQIKSEWTQEKEVEHLASQLTQHNINHVVNNNGTITINQIQNDNSIQMINNYNTEILNNRKTLSQIGKNFVLFLILTIFINTLLISSIDWEYIMSLSLFPSLNKPSILTELFNNIGSTVPLFIQNLYHTFAIFVLVYIFKICIVASKFNQLKQNLYIVCVHCSIAVSYFSISHINPNIKFDKIKEYLAQIYIVPDNRTILLIGMIITTFIISFMFYYIDLFYTLSPFISTKSKLEKTFKKIAATILMLGIAVAYFFL